MLWRVRVESPAYCLLPHLHKALGLPLPVTLAETQILDIGALGQHHPHPQAFSYKHLFLSCTRFDLPSLDSSSLSEMCTSCRIRILAFVCDEVLFYSPLINLSSCVSVSYPTLSRANGVTWSDMGGSSSY